MLKQILECNLLVNQSTIPKKEVSWQSDRLHVLDMEKQESNQNRIKEDDFYKRIGLDGIEGCYLANENGIYFSKEEDMMVVAANMVGNNCEDGVDLIPLEKLSMVQH